MASTIEDFPINSNGTGAAFPTFPTDLAPAVFDDALGATAARKEWEQANAQGLALYRAMVAKRTAWTDNHRETDFSDRAAWLFARDKHVRDDEVAVKAAEKRSVSALRAYRAAQRFSGDNLVAVASDAARKADERARKAVEDLEQALKDRAAAVAHAGGTLALRNLTTQVPQALKDLVGERVLYSPAPPAVSSPRSVKARGDLH